MPKQSGIIVEQAQLSVDPAAPASGYSVLFPKTDGNIYFRAAGQSVKQLVTDLFTINGNSIRGVGNLDLSDTLDIDNAGATGQGIIFAVGNTIYGRKLIAGANITITANGDDSLTIASTAAGGGDQTLDDVLSEGNVSTQGMSVGSIDIAGSITNNTFRVGGVGGFGVQHYADNNVFFTNNVRYNSGWVRGNTGFASLLYFTQAGLQFLNSATGAAGSAATMTEQFRVDNDGTIIFNGAYSFPKTIGSPGQFFKVPATGTVLEWGTGSGGSGGGTLNDVLLAGNSSSQRMALTGNYSNLPNFQAGGLYTQSFSNTNQLIYANGYFDGTNHKYVQNGTLTLLQLAEGAVNISGAPSGTAGGNASTSNYVSVTSSGVTLYGAYTLPTVAGSPNQVLAMPASGTQLIWAAAGSGGSQSLNSVLGVGNTSSIPFAITGDKTSSTSATFNSFSIQGYSPLNTILGANTYYNNTDGSFKAVTTGAGAYIQLAGDQVVIGKTNSGSAGANVSNAAIALFDAAGTIIYNLVGTGTRMVVATDSGQLSTQAIPSGGGIADPLTTNGDIISRVSGETTRLAAGTLGYVLTSNGGNNNISYQMPPGFGQDATYTTLTGFTNTTSPTLMTGSMQIDNLEAGIMEVTVYAINGPGTDSYVRKFAMHYRGTSTTTATLGDINDLVPGESLGSGMAGANAYASINANGDLVVYVVAANTTSVQWRAEIKKYKVNFAS